MSTTTAQASREHDALAPSDAGENQSPNLVKAALRSVMKTASKPLRVPADIDECSPTPVRVLRNGKRVRATPRLPKASRVTLSPEDTKALDGADRVPLAQAQREPATPPTQPMPMQGRTPPASSDDQQLSIATPEGDASEDAPLTPATVISSMQQLQLAESMPESLLLCQESLAESSSGALPAPEDTIGTEASSARLPGPAGIQVDEPAAVSPRAVEQGSVSDAGQHASIALTPAHMPKAGSQGATPACTPQHHADAAAAGATADDPTMPSPSSEGSRQAAAPVCTPEQRPGAHSATEPCVDTPVPSDATSGAEGQAAASVKTPLPRPSPQLPGQSDLVTPPAQVSDDAETPEVDASHLTQHDAPDEAQEESTQQEASGVEGNTTEVCSYVARGKRTPFMERKLRALQATEWADQDVGRVHKSRLEREKEAAAAARRNSLSSADRAATRRLVRNTFARAVDTQGKDLGETMVKHKSRLEREKEAALARKESSPLGSFGQTRQRRSPAGSSFAGQGLGAMKTHMGRLEKERAAAAAKKAAGVSSPAVESRLPSYMRQTAASVAMQKEGGLGENTKVHKSQLEKDRETALALQAARKKAGHNPLTPYPVKRGSMVKPRLSFGSLGGGPAHKSKLEQAKEAAVAASAAGATAAPRPRPPKSAASSRAASAPGAGLGDMKPHKSRLEREKEAWARQASARGAPKAAGAAASDILQERHTNTISVAPANKPGSREGAVSREGFSDYVPN